MVEFADGRKVLIEPVTYEDIKDIRIGDIVYYSGMLTTGRDDVHIRVVHDGLELPFDIREGALMHAGPIVRSMEDGSYEMVSVGPTTSMRMEKFEYDFVRETGIRVIIGKGGMKERTADACREFGAIHCVFPAGNAVFAAMCVDAIEDVEWLDLGMPEALWRCRVREFGPLIVSIDSRGKNYFEEIKVDYERRKEEQIAAISELVDYMK